VVRDFDMIVVGAGYGGVTVAALAAKAGQRVLLVDKNKQAGGKAMTIHGEGYHYEMWPVFGTPHNNSRFHELRSELGIAEKDAPLIGPIPQGGGGYKGPDGEWRSQAGSTDQSGDAMGVNHMKELYGATDADLAQMGKLFGDIMGTPDGEIDRFDDVGTLGWLRSYELPEGIVTMLASMLNFVFVAPVNRLPVSETIKTLRDLYTNTGGRYNGGGFGRLAELAADYVATHGGEFLTGARVEQILVEGGRATGVATSTAEFRAPVVVSNAGIQPTMLKYVDEQLLPSEYVERVRGLEPGWGFIGCRYFLDAPVLKSGIATAYSDQSWWDDERYAAAADGHWPDAALVFMGTTTNYDPSLAPEGHQIIQMGTVGSPDPEAKDFNQQVIEHAEATAREVWPEVFDHVIRRDPYTALQVSRLTRDSAVPGQGGECIGLGQVIGQCGQSKPDARTPLPGLYLTGCDAGGYGCGTHQAVDSGFNVAEMIREDIAG
jgi:phytoene dehydrogenase-like protein